jgi:hypothetical protein
MEEKKEKEYIIVCALDIGSWGSGYAFLSTREQDPKITVEQNWGGLNVKTATDVLFEDGEFFAFGNESIAEFLEAIDDPSRNLELYEKFKMVLLNYTGRDSRNQLQVSDVSGTKKRSAQELFMHTMSFLKEHAMKRIHDSYPRVQDSDIRWVITVPAIWTPQAKLIMKNAAYDAKLWTETDPDQVILCYEPEAALYECKVSNPRDVVIKPGDQYLVVDCGGGTADFAAHQVCENGENVKEVLPPSGDNWGSNYVNSEFERVLFEIFGSELMASIRREKPTLYLNLFEKFETEKTKRRLPSSKLSFRIEINPTLQQMIETRARKTIAELLGSKPSFGISFDPDSKTLIIEEQGIELLMQNTTNEISNWTSHLLSNPILDSVKYVFLVGGFANSKSLENAIKNCERVKALKIPVVVPKLPELCVLKGACRFGINPRSPMVGKRISPMTYGLRIDREFRHTDPIRCKKVVDGEEICCDVFDPILAKDSVLTADSVWEESYRTLSDNVSLDLFAHSGDSGAVSYVFDKGVNSVGSIKIQFPLKFRGILKEIHVKIIFGGTSLEVTCVSSVGDMKSHSIQLSEI